MKVVLQRVLSASVEVNGKIIAVIKQGLLVLVGIEDADKMEDITWLSNKIINLRIFDDQNKIPNLSVKESAGDIIVVSQFTLQASTKKGNRPSYIKASKGAIALPLFEKLIVQIENDFDKKIQTGKFGEDMKVASVNDGPLTIIIDTQNRE